MITAVGDSQSQNQPKDLWKMIQGTKGNLSWCRLLFSFTEKATRKRKEIFLKQRNERRCRPRDEDMLNQTVCVIYYFMTSLAIFQPHSPIYFHPAAGGVTGSYRLIFDASLMVVLKVNLDINVRRSREEKPTIDITKKKVRSDSSAAASRANSQWICCETNSHPNRTTVTNVITSASWTHRQEESTSQGPLWEFNHTGLTWTESQKAEELTGFLSIE